MDEPILDWVLEETPVSDVFILQYMKELEGLPLRLYLLLCYFQKRKEQFSSSLICRLLGATPADLKKALIQLSVAQVIDLHEDGEDFSWIDLRKREIESYFSVQTPVPVAQENPDRMKFLREISRSFFGGRMSPTWYRVIEGVFQTYRFEEQVVYQLLCECNEQGALKTPSYLKEVARNWSKRGILTFADLEADRDRFRRSKEVEAFVSNYLHRTLTEPERRIVRNWVEILQFDESIIQLALDRSVGLTHPTIKYFDRILKSWQTEGLRTPEEIAVFEEQRKKRNVRRSRCDKGGLEPNIGTEAMHGEDYSQGVAQWQALLGMNPEDEE